MISAVVCYNIRAFLLFLKLKLAYTLLNVQRSEIYNENEKADFVGESENSFYLSNRKLITKRYTVSYLLFILVISGAVCLYATLEMMKTNNFWWPWECFYIALIIYFGNFVLALFCKMRGSIDSYGIKGDFKLSFLVCFPFVVFFIAFNLLYQVGSGLGIWVYSVALYPFVVLLNIVRMWRPYLISVHQRRALLTYQIL